MDKNKKARNMRPTQAALNVVKTPPSKTDPLGMYTGVPMDKSDVPQQDQDDL